MFNTKHSAAAIRLKLMAGHPITEEERTLYLLVEAEIAKQRRINAGQA